MVCGARHTLCVTATSQVYAWGHNGDGQLGLGDTLDRRAPTLLEGLWAMPVLQLAAGERGVGGEGEAGARGRRAVAGHARAPARARPLRPALASAPSHPHQARRTAQR